jgi:hypothetical protein
LPPVTAPAPPPPAPFQTPTATKPKRKKRHKKAGDGSLGHNQSGARRDLIAPVEGETPTPAATPTESSNVTMEGNDAGRAQAQTLLDGANSRLAHHRPFETHGGYLSGVSAGERPCRRRAQGHGSGRLSGRLGPRAQSLDLGRSAGRPYLVPMKKGQGRIVKRIKLAGGRAARSRGGGYVIRISFSPPASDTSYQLVRNMIQQEACQGWRLRKNRRIRSRNQHYSCGYPNDSFGCDRSQLAAQHLQCTGCQIRVSSALNDSCRTESASLPQIRNWLGRPEM